LKNCIVKIAFFLLPVLVSAQRADTSALKPRNPVIDTAIVVTDTFPTEKKRNFIGRFFKNDYPNPRKALFFSLVLPGAGQIYNKRWWKVPIVYAALGGCAFVEINNINQYRLWRDNYRLKVDGDTTNDPTEQPFARLDATTMRKNRDIARRNLEQSSLVLGFALLLNATDAFVDAHLGRFDVSEDLSLRPHIQTVPGFGAAPGLSLAFTLK
jgi:Family of unknown function (DUF5683)